MDMFMFEDNCGRMYWAFSLWGNSGRKSGALEKEGN